MKYENHSGRCGYRSADRSDYRRRSALVFRWAVGLLFAGGLLTAFVLVQGGRTAFERTFLRQVAAFGGADAQESLSEAERIHLQTVLREGTPEARVQAAYDLARWRDRASVVELVAAMQDGSGVGRPCQIAHSLGRIGDSTALPALREALDHPDNIDLRACAALAIGEIGDPSTLPFLLDRINEPELSEGAQASALLAVWDIASSRAMPELRKVAASHPREDLRTMAAAAVRGLSCLEADAATGALLAELAGYEPWVRSDWILRQVERTWSGAESATALNAFIRNQPELKRSELVWLAGLLEYHGAWEAQTLRTLADSSRKPERWVAEVAEALRPSPKTGTIAQTNL